MLHVIPVKESQQIYNLLVETPYFLAIPMKTPLSISVEATVMRIYMTGASRWFLNTSVNKNGDKLALSTFCDPRSLLERSSQEASCSKRVLWKLGKEVYFIFNGGKIKDQYHHVVHIRADYSAISVFSPGGASFIAFTSTDPP